MTMPSERTRAVIHTGEFLQALSQDASLPESVRRQARGLLRHYPSREETLHAGQLEEQLTEGTLFQPTISSSIDE